MTYQWLLFDADGTLFDYDRAETAALKASFAQFDLPFDLTSSDTYRKVNSAVWADFEQGKITVTQLRTVRFERLFTALNLDVDAETFSTAYLNQLGARGDLIPGVDALVEACYGRYQLMIITNGLKDVQRKRLAHSKLGKYFVDIIISDEIGSAKPDSKIFDVAFARMGNPQRDDVLMIGDSLTSDMQGGLNYGIDTCWYNPQQRPLPTDLPLTYQIQQLAELKTILDL
ncbi:MAG: YjjG family noncanonical pyrimidine nucleotidase [Anaerolineales bacterium]|nr:YjjG family noncanonical pyrimidine nucleotidase [Anaerolineales bacterium]